VASGANICEIPSEGGEARHHKKLSWTRRNLGPGLGETQRKIGAASSLARKTRRTKLVGITDTTSRKSHDQQGPKGNHEATYHPNPPKLREAAPLITNPVDFQRPRYATAGNETIEPGAATTSPQNHHQQQIIAVTPGKGEYLLDCTTTSRRTQKKDRRKTILRKAPKAGGNQETGLSQEPRNKTKTAVSNVERREVLAIENE